MDDSIVGAFLFLMILGGIFGVMFYFYCNEPYGAHVDNDERRLIFRKGYAAGYNAACQMAAQKFEEMEKMIEDLGYENHSLKKSYELYLKNKVGELLKNTDKCA